MEATKKQDAEWRRETLRLDQLRRDTQARAGTDPAVVSEYAEAMREGAIFPPVLVFFDGEAYWLVDGYHRAEAAETLGILDVIAKVRDGTQRDAALFAAGTNITHGLRRSNADKRAAVGILLRDEEWGAWSDRVIAERCGVSHTFVSNLRAELAATGNGLQSDERVGKDGRTINTANIGRAPAREYVEIEVRRDPGAPPGEVSLSSEHLARMEASFPKSEVRYLVDPELTRERAPKFIEIPIRTVKQGDSEQPESPAEENPAEALTPTTPEPETLTPDPARQEPPIADRPANGAALPWQPRERPEYKPRFLKRRIVLKPRSLGMTPLGDAFEAIGNDVQALLHDLLPDEQHGKLYRRAERFMDGVRKRLEEYRVLDYPTPPMRTIATRFAGALAFDLGKEFKDTGISRERWSEISRFLVSRLEAVLKNGSEAAIGTIEEGAEDEVEGAEAAMDELLTMKLCVPRDRHCPEDEPPPHIGRQPLLPAPLTAESIDTDRLLGRVAVRVGDECIHSASITMNAALLVMRWLRLHPRTQRVDVIYGLAAVIEEIADTPLRDEVDGATRTPLVDAIELRLRWTAADLLRQAWKQSNAEERAWIRKWVDEQEGEDDGTPAPTG